MKQLATLATLILIFATSALAQDDYRKYEFFGGIRRCILTTSPAIHRTQQLMMSWEKANAARL